MKKLLCCGILACLVGQARAGAWTVPAGTVRFSPSVFFYSAQRQFSPAGALTHLTYEGSFHMAILTCYGEWGATNDLTIIGDLPVSSIAFDARDSTHSYTRSLVAPSYYGVGARYAVWRPGASVVSLTGAVHVPAGLHNGLYDDPHYPFLSDGYFEEILGCEFGSAVPWGWYEAAALFHARGEEAANQLELRGVIGFARQRGAQIKLTIAAVKSLARIPDAPLFAEETNAVEDYLWMDGQVLFFLSDRLAIAASLGLRVIGAHTLELNGGGVSLLF